MFSSFLNIGLGNPRGNENPFLLTFGVMWFRYHNWLAREVRREFPSYSDERVFNEARIRNIATHQVLLYFIITKLIRFYHVQIARTTTDQI